jgi:GlcNAc-PI de-N-acetylase
LLVLAAHPDDETLGAGELLTLCARRDVPVTVVIATDSEASHPNSPTTTPAQCEVVVVLDLCQDATGEVVAGHPGVELRTSGAGVVGAARRAGAHGLPGNPRHWLASTDADCRVPFDWLTG